MADNKSKITYIFNAELSNFNKGVQEAVKGLSDVTAKLQGSTKEAEKLSKLDYGSKALSLLAKSDAIESQLKKLKAFREEMSKGLPSKATDFWSSSTKQALIDKELALRSTITKMESEVKRLEAFANRYDRLATKTSSSFVNGMKEIENRLTRTNPNKILGIDTSGISKASESLMAFSKVLKNAERDEAILVRNMEAGFKRLATAAMGALVNPKALTATQILGYSPNKFGSLTTKDSLFAGKDFKPYTADLDRQKAYTEQSKELAANRTNFVKQKLAEEAEAKATATAKQIMLDKAYSEAIAIDRARDEANWKKSWEAQAKANFEAIKLAGQSQKYQQQRTKEIFAEIDATKKLSQAQKELLQAQWKATSKPSNSAAGIREMESRAAATIAAERKRLEELSRSIKFPFETTKTGLTSNSFNTSEDLKAIKQVAKEKELLNQQELAHYKQQWEAQAKLNWETIKATASKRKADRDAFEQTMKEVALEKAARLQSIRDQYKALPKPLAPSVTGMKLAEERARATIAANERASLEASSKIRFPFEKAPSSLTSNDFLSAKELTALKKEQAAIEKKAAEIAATKEKEGLQWAREWATQLQQNIAAKNTETAAEKALIRELDLEIVKRQQLAKESRLLELKNQYALLPKQRPLSTLKQAEASVAYIQSPQSLKDLSKVQGTSASKLYLAKEEAAYKAYLSNIANYAKESRDKVNQYIKDSHAQLLATKQQEQTATKQWSDGITNTWNQAWQKQIQDKKAADAAKAAIEAKEKQRLQDLKNLAVSKSSFSASGYFGNQAAEEQARLTKMAALQKEYQNTVTKLAAETASKQAAIAKQQASLDSKFLADAKLRFEQYQKARVDKLLYINALQEEALAINKIKDANTLLKQAIDNATASQQRHTAQWEAFKNAPNTNSTSWFAQQAARAAALAKEIALVRELARLEASKKAGMLSLGGGVDSRTLAPATGKFTSLSGMGGKSATQIQQEASAMNLLHTEALKLNAAYDKETSSIKALEAARLKSLAAMQQEVHHHDSLIVRAFKLVSIYSLLNAVRQDILAGLRSIPATGIELESTHAVFKAIFVTQKDITEQFEFLDNLADRTGARLLTLQESFRDFAASAKFSGESIGNIHQIFNDITEAGTVLHLPADKMKSAFIAINQMYAKGQVMMEELKKQLGNQLPAAVAVFARSLGLSTAMLMDKMKKGLIRPEDSIAGFAAMYKQIFATRDAFEIASQGMNAAIGRLDTEWTRVAQGIYKATSSYMIAGLKGATSALTWFKDNLGLVATVAGVAAVAIGVHLVQAFTAFAIRAAIARTELNLLTIGYASMSAAARASAIATASTPLTALASQLAIIGRIALRWAGWVGVIIGVGTAIYKVGQATINVNGESVKLFDILDEGWLQAAEGASKYYDIIANKGKTWYQEIIDSTSQDFTELAAFYDSINQTRDMRGNLIPSTPLFSMADVDLTPQIAIDRAAKQKAKAAADAAQAIEDQKLAEERKVLFEDTGLAARGEANAGIVAKNIELQTKVSQQAITRIGHTVQMELKILEVQKNNLDKSFERNELEVMDYYRQQIVLLEKKYALETKGDEARLQILQQEERARIAYEERLVNQELENKGLEDKKNLLQNIAEIAAYNTKDAAGKAIEYIHTFATSAEVLSKGNLFGARIAENRAAMDREDFKTGEAAYIKAHGTSVGYSFKSKFTDVPLTTSQEYRDTSRTFIEKETKVQMEKLTNAITVNTATQTKLATNKGMQETISATVSGALSSKGNTKYDSLILKHAEDTGVDPNFIKAVMKAESAFNPDATSPVGAKGLMQLMPDTAVRYGVKVGDRTDPDQSLKGGVRYLRDLLKMFGQDKAIAAAGYNAGENAVKRHNNKIPPYPETQNYVKVVMANLAEYEGRPAPKGSGLRTTKSSAPTNKATTETRIATSATEEVTARMAERKFEVEQARLGLKKQELYMGKQLQIELEKNSLIYKQQNGTLDSIGVAKLFELENSLQLSKLEVSKTKALEAINGLTKGLTEEELKQYKLNLPLIEQDQARLKLVKERLVVTTEIERSLALLKAKRDYDAAKQANEAPRQTGYDWVDAWNEQATNTANNTSRMESLQEEKTKLEATQKLSPEGSIDWLKQASEIEKVKESMVALNETTQVFTKKLADQSFKMVGDEFLNWANGAKSAGRAFKDLAIGFARMIQDMLIQALQAAAIKAVMHMFGLSTGGSVGGGGGTAGASFTSGGYIPAYASGGNVLSFPTGGMVRGKGTNTSDSNLASVAKGSFILNAKATAKAKKNQLVALSNNELVISPEQVANIGLSTLKDINAEKYAGGGLVGGSNTSGSSSKTGGNANNVYNINVAVPEGTKNPQQFGKDAGLEIAKTIAREEARKQIALYDKKKANGR